MIIDPVKVVEEIIVSTVYFFYLNTKYHIRTNLFKKKLHSSYIVVMILLDKFPLWLNVNNLSLNINNTQYMVFAGKREMVKNLI